jgi:peptidoglycan/xylan/chitin deacetylase (PgdA/CDA1 family)
MSGVSQSLKRTVLLLLSVLLGGASLVLAVPVRAEATNLIANPSVEQVTPGTPSKPQFWQSNKWGANTSNFAYPNTGHTGTRSVRVNMTSFTDGDAKWFFDPVAVGANKTYNFSDYYRSNTATEIVVRYTHQGGTFSYAWLGTLPASNAWAITTQSFTTPATATHATVFHLISSVGFLILDDADLRESTPPLPSDNLAPNASVEQVTPGNVNKPNLWQSNKWGTNTATFTYPNSNAHTGTRSVRAEITAYTDGDAKWFFDPVNVTPDTPHVFSDWYKSNVATQVIVRYTHANGSTTYEWLGNTLASSAWQQASFNFTPTATVRQVTVFHLLNSVGWLQTDDVHLAKAQLSNPVPNPSVELASANDPTRPDKWVKDNWGDNAANFEYLNEGHSGNKSVKVTVGGHVDGDAKWFFEDQVLEQGRSYKFNVWYKSNTTPHVVARHLKADGTYSYLEMREPYPTATAATEWQQYSEPFTVPVGTQSTTIFFFVASNGWLQTDDYEIAPYQMTGFTRPLVSLTFDDSFIDNTQTALPVLDQYGFKSTQCYGTEFVEAVEEGRPAVLTFYNGGHEICSHSVTHPLLTQMTPPQVQFELEHSQDVLESIIGVPVVNFAYPFGDYNFMTNQQAKQYYRSNRTVDEGFNSKDNFDIERIMVQNMLVDTTLTEFQSWLDYAKATNTWLVLVYHRVTTEADIEPFDTPTPAFVQQMAALNTSGLTVKTYNAALDELVPQLP